MDIRSKLVRLKFFQDICDSQLRSWLRRGVIRLEDVELVKSELRARSRGLSRAFIKNL